MNFDSIQQGALCKNACILYLFLQTFLQEEGWYVHLLDLWEEIELRLLSLWLCLAADSLIRICSSTPCGGAGLGTMKETDSFYDCISFF